VGTSKDTTFCGRSAVIDPWGRTLVEGGNDEELLTVTVDLEDVDTARHQIPVFGDRRPELY
jgi:omega-amidase